MDLVLILQLPKLIRKTLKAHCTITDAVSPLILIVKIDIVSICMSPDVSKKCFMTRAIRVKDNTTFSTQETKQIDVTV